MPNISDALKGVKIEKIAVFVFYIIALAFFIGYSKSTLDSYDKRIEQLEKNELQQYKEMRDKIDDIYKIVIEQRNNSKDE